MDKKVTKIDAAPAASDDDVEENKVTAPGALVFVVCAG